MYNATKAAQIVAFLALKTPLRALNIVKAMKLVYLADREMLQMHGLPMLDETRVSMRLGPVNSLTYAHACGEVEDAGWSSVLEDRADHMIGVRPQVAAGDLDELSVAEVAVLDDLWTRFGSMTQWELVDWTHNSRNVPEWEDPGHSAHPIPLERLLQAVGFADAARQAEFLDDHAQIASRYAGR